MTDPSFVKKRMEISNVELHNAITCRITLNCSELFLCGMGLGLNFIRQGGGNEAGWERLSVAHGLDQPKTALVGSETPDRGLKCLPNPVGLLDRNPHT
jgi:hypothetical protein